MSDDKKCGAFIACAISHVCIAYIVFYEPKSLNCKITLTCTNEKRDWKIVFECNSTALTTSLSLKGVAVCSVRFVSVWRSLRRDGEIMQRDEVAINSSLRRQTESERTSQRAGQSLHRPRQQLSTGSSFVRLSRKSTRMASDRLDALWRRRRCGVSVGSTMINDEHDEPDVRPAGRNTRRTYRPTRRWLGRSCDRVVGRVSGLRQFLEFIAWKWFGDADERLLSCFRSAIDSPSWFDVRATLYVGSSVHHVAYSRAQDFAMKEDSNCRCLSALRADKRILRSERISLYQRDAKHYASLKLVKLKHQISFTH